MEKTCPLLTPTYPGKPKWSLPSVDVPVTQVEGSSVYKNAVKDNAVVGGMGSGVVYMCSNPMLSVKWWRAIHLFHSLTYKMAKILPIIRHNEIKSPPHSTQ